MRAECRRSLTLLPVLMAPRRSGRRGIVVRVVSAAVAVAVGNVALKATQAKMARQDRQVATDLWALSGRRARTGMMGRTACRG